MTKKHFEAIAKILSQWAERNSANLQWLTYTDLIDSLALYLKHQNPLFDENRFYQACFTKNWKVTHIS